MLRWGYHEVQGHPSEEAEAGGPEEDQVGTAADPGITPLSIAGARAPVPQPAGLVLQKRARDYATVDQ